MWNVIKKSMKGIALKRWLRSSLALLIAVAIVAGLFWQLRLTGEAMSEDIPTEVSVSAVLQCGLEEHTHSEACEHNILICGLEQPATETENGTPILPDENAHYHDESCYSATCICGLEEHSHTDACYAAATDLMSGEVTEGTGAPEITEATEVTEIAEETEAAENTAATETAVSEVTEVTEATEATEVTETTEATEVAERTETAVFPTAENSTDLTTDDARITDLGLIAIVDGTADKADDGNEYFDDEPKDGEQLFTPEGAEVSYVPGDDTGPNNRVVRTFDTVSYQVKYTTQTKNETTSYEKGRLMIQAVIPGCTLQEAKFQLENMLWLEDAMQRNVVADGKNYVLLTGYYILEPNQESGAVTAIPGEGKLTFIIKVQGMKNGASVSPQFYMWMEYNACAYDPAGVGYTDLSDDGTQVIYNYFPTDKSYIDPRVGSNGETYEDVQCLSEGMTVYVSAAPKYNVEIKRHMYVDDLGDRDFSNIYKENDVASQQESVIREFMSSVRTPSEGGDSSESYFATVYGRMIGVEVSLQLYNDTKNKGLKGIELPDSDESIFIELTVNSSYLIPGDKWYDMTSLDNGKQYTPLLWDYEASTRYKYNCDSDNSGGVDIKVGELGRKMRQRQIASTYSVSFPANSLDPDGIIPKKAACYSGGTWKVEQNTETISTGYSMRSAGQDYYTNTFSITVEGFEFFDEEGNYHFPTNYMGNIDINPVFGEQFGVGCFSSGYLQILLPMPEEIPAGSDTNKYSVTAQLVSATSVSGQVASDSENAVAEGSVLYPQMRTTDDSYSREFPWSVGMGLGNYHLISGRWLDEYHNYTGRSNSISASSIGPFRAEVNVATNRADDGWAPLAYEGVMWARYDATSNLDDALCPSAMNVFIKFDANGAQPIDIDPHYMSEDGTLNTSNPEDAIAGEEKKYPWAINEALTESHTDFDMKVFYAALTDGVNWSDTGDVVDVDEVMCETEMWDEKLIYYSSMKELQAVGETCVGVLIELRGGLLTGRTYVGIPVVLTSETENIDKVFDMTSHTVAWAEAQEGATMTFSETPDAGGCSWADLVTQPPAEESEESVLETDSATTSYSFKENVAKYVRPTYHRSTYENNGTITSSVNNDSTFINYALGFSYLIVGNYAYLTKTVTNPQNGTDGADCYLDIDKNHRTVDYIIEVNAEMDDDENHQVGGTNETGRATITVADLLPEKVRIEPNTEFVITYNDKQLTLKLGEEGTDTGELDVEGSEIPITVRVEKIITTTETVINGNTVPAGRTVLVYTFENAVISDATGTYLIGYSAEVGEPGGDEETTEVKNTEQLTSIAWVRCTGDNRKLEEKVGNITSATFKIVKNGQSALLKKVKEPVVEVSAPITFNIIYNNMSSAAYDSYYILDVLPYSDDILGSKFDGTYSVTDISFDLANFAGELKVWYLTGERGSVSTALDATYLESDENELYLNYIGGDGAETSKAFAQADVTEVTDADGKVIAATIENVPEDVIAIVFGGSLDGNKRITMNITIDPAQNHASDFYRNRATMVADLSDTVAVISPVASATVVQRIISGLAWEDVDADGIREEGEKLLPGIEVTLYKLNDADGYVPVTENRNGDSLENMVTDSNGAYSFNALDAGTYKVVFGNVGYEVSPENQGKDDSKDSDAIASEGEIYIDNIVLHEIAELVGDIERSDHHDLGLNHMGPILPETGGSGTTAYYVFGALLMILAEIIYIFRKKQHA